MQAPPSSLLKRLPPGVWVVLAWCGGMAFTFLMRLRLPGEWYPAERPGAQFFQWEGQVPMAVATALAPAGGALLRRRPLPALVLLLAASVLGTMPLGVAEIPLPQFLAAEVAVFFIAAGRPRATGVVAVVMALAVLGGYLAVRLVCGWPIGASSETAVALTTVIAWLLGSSARESRTHAEELRARAATQAVTDERLRIARELHDMVAHSIGVIALQAGAARRVIDTQPERAREALGEIETAGRRTLSGLRRMLGGLRGPEQGRPAPSGPPGAAPLGSGHLEPAFGLADVDRLAATITEAGVWVDVRRSGEPRPLPPEIEVSAYRIIQEAVTNVVRHAGTASCRVSIGYRDDEVRIEVLDDGRGGDTGGGYGLIGMRERVGALHGTFAAGPRPEGGFRVEARLPVSAGVR
ncbi:sensor histidine kinase [Microbispora catharanthi]|uniref:histidine kinase n=1 Tax=Microbispora catharanthi TaxID=1712871 RepID=A0A5N6BK77_9ACTN|nr:histidine kinase [Microbispora catharanthi]KAB8181457.1 sensor histidine kinase [Microbispora catharanthi]